MLRISKGMMMKNNSQSPYLKLTYLLLLVGFIVLGLFGLNHLYAFLFDLKSHSILKVLQGVFIIGISAFCIQYVANKIPRTEHPSEDDIVQEF
jgi:hypothetical protein